MKKLLEFFESSEQIREWPTLDSVAFDFLGTYPEILMTKHNLLKLFGLFSKLRLIEIAQEANKVTIELSQLGLDILTNRKSLPISFYKNLLELS